MKCFLIAIVMSLCCGCLVPGAPHSFHYKLHPKSTDSVRVVSTQHHLGYEYLPTKADYDSVLLVDPIYHDLKRMELKENFYNESKPFYLYYKREGWNLHKIKKVDYIVLKRYRQNAVTVDTLCYYKVR